MGGGCFWRVSWRWGVSGNGEGIYADRMGLLLEYMAIEDKRDDRYMMIYCYFCYFVTSVTRVTSVTVCLLFIFIRIEPYHHRQNAP